MRENKVRHPLPESRKERRHDNRPELRPQRALRTPRAGDLLD